MQLTFTSVLLPLTQINHPASNYCNTVLYSHKQWPTLWSCYTTHFYRVYQLQHQSHLWAFFSSWWQWLIWNYFNTIYSWQNQELTWDWYMVLSSADDNNKENEVMAVSGAHKWNDGIPTTLGPAKKKVATSSCSQEVFPVEQHYNFWIFLHRRDFIV